MLFCITLARLVTTSMARLLRSRRGKDLAAFLIIPLFALYEFFTQVVPKEAADGTFTTASFGGIDSWLRWLPPGLAAHAIQDASDGHPGTALLRLALLAAVIVVLGWLWVRSLSRALVTADTTTQSSRVHGAALPLARYGLRGAVTARFWIYQRREPASLVFWAITAVIMAAVSARAILGPDGHPAFVLGSAVVGAGFVGYFHANTVGLTGPPFVLEASALTGRRELRSYFSGQDIVLGVIAVPLLTAVSFGLAAVAGRPGFGFLGTAVGLAGLGAALALSNIFTVVIPYPMDKRAGNPMRQAAQGYTSYQFLAVFGSVGGTALHRQPGDHRHRAHERGSGQRPDAGAADFRRRLRPGAGHGRHADRGRRGRGKAARALPGRHPQQALEHRGSGPQASPETLDALGGSARLGASTPWLATRALRRHRPGRRVRWQQFGADRDHPADRAVGQGQPLDLDTLAGRCRRGGTECLHDRHVRRVGDIQCRYVHAPGGPRFRVLSHCTTGRPGPASQAVVRESPGTGGLRRAWPASRSAVASLP